MLNEKLMKALESIQRNICLECEKKLAYVLAFKPGGHCGYNSCKGTCYRYCNSKIRG